MADIERETAIHTVAQRIADAALDTGYATAPSWENYPEIGEADWYAVEAVLDGWRAERYSEPIQNFTAAYDYLKGRANK